MWREQGAVRSEKGGALVAQAPLLPITDILNGKTNREIRMFVLFDNSALS